MKKPASSVGCDHLQPASQLSWSKNPLRLQVRLHPESPHPDTCTIPHPAVFQETPAPSSAATQATRLLQQQLPTLPHPPVRQDQLLSRSAPSAAEQTHRHTYTSVSRHTQPLQVLPVPLQVAPACQCQCKQALSPHTCCWLSPHPVLTFFAT